MFQALALRQSKMPASSVVIKCLEKMMNFCVWLTNLGRGIICVERKKNNHVSHQGPSNDKTKEYTQAKDRGIHIVSPHWLYSCQEKNQRVDETMYPHTFNPKLSLPVVTTGRRMTRSSRAVSIVVYKPCLV